MNNEKEEEMYWHNIAMEQICKLSQQLLQVYPQLPLEFSLSFSADVLKNFGVHIGIEEGENELTITSKAVN